MIMVKDFLVGKSGFQFSNTFVVHNYHSLLSLWTFVIQYKPFFLYILPWSCFLTLNTK